MAEIVVEIQHIPTITDKNYWDILEEKAVSCYEYVVDRCSHLWRLYRATIICILLLMIVMGLIITVGVLSRTASAVNPCASYQSDTLASTVTVSCLQYQWDQACRSKAPYTFSSDYHGWWLQSPQGPAMVACNQAHSGTACGVGTYGNIMVYAALCNISLNQ